MKKMRMIVTSLLLGATMIGAPVAGTAALAAPGRGPAPVHHGYNRGPAPAPRHYDRGYGPSHYDRGPSHYGRRDHHKSSDTALKVGVGVLALGLILGAAANSDRD